MSILGYTSWAPQTDTVSVATLDGNAVDLYVISAATAPACPTDPTQVTGATVAKAGISTTYNLSVVKGNYCYYLRAAGTHTGTPNFMEADTTTSASKTNVVESKVSSKMTQLVITVIPRVASTTVPTGTLTFSVGQYNVNTSSGFQVFTEGLTNGTVTIQLPTAMLKQNVMQVLYSGDSNYGVSSYNCTPSAVPQ